MKSEIVYNVTARHLGDFPGANLIVRSDKPREIVDSLAHTDLSRVRFIQLLSTPPDTAELEEWGTAIPIDIILKDPAAEFALLYNYTNLLDTHPVRVSIPALPGVSKAAKQAVSLSFAVKLNLGQPDNFVIDELSEVLDFYLHRTSVRQPVEFFQTLLLSFYQPQPASLWEIAEEDPAQVVYVTDDGEKTISSRFAGAELGPDLAGFVERYGQEMISERRQCHDCEFFSRCGGYFKWPDKLYDCRDVKTLLAKLSSAADELKTDLAAFAATVGGLQP